MKKKILLTIFLGIFAVMMVSAGVLTYYALISVNINVTQPVSINGNLAEEIEISMDIEDGVAGETRIGDTINLFNDAETERAITITIDSDEGIETSYVGFLELTSKDTTTWDITEDLKATIRYTVIGDTFKYEIIDSTNFNEEDYTLIYYKDNEENSDDEDRLTTIGSLEDFSGSFPYTNDWNVGEDANYCDNGYDNYDSCKGAKLWLVLTDDINGDGELTWANWNSYLYELDLVQYNSDSKLVIYGNSEMEIVPVFELNPLLSSGDYNVAIKIK